MDVCSAGEVGLFPAFFSTMWRRKRKNFHVSSSPVPIGNTGKFWLQSSSSMGSFVYVSYWFTVTTILVPLGIVLVGEGDFWNCENVQVLYNITVVVQTLLLTRPTVIACRDESEVIVYTRQSHGRTSEPLLPPTAMHTFLASS